MKKEDNPKQNSDLSQLGNVEQIREILFGSQSREVQEKFDKLEESMKSMHEEMRKKMQQAELDFNAKIESEVETISRKIKNLSTQQQDELVDVRDAALKQEKRFQNALDIVEEELNAKREQLQKQHTESNITLRAQMDTLQDEMLQILDEKIAALGLNKLSREDAADILMEAAMAMKGTHINQQLSMASIETK